MNNQPEDIIITIDVDKQGAAKQVVSLKKELEQLTAVRKALKDNLKAGILTEDEYTESLVETEKKAAALRAELSKQQAVLKQQVAIQNAAAGSLNQMRAQANLTTIEVAGLSAAERTYSKDGTALVASLTDQIAALKSVEKGYGDNRREVGNYALATEKTNQLLAEQQAQSKKTSQAFSTLDSTFGLFGGKLEDAKEKFRSTKAGLEATQLGLTGLKGAIAATGIGLLLLALGTLYTLLTKTQGGLDFVERKTAAVGKVMQFLTDKVIVVGRTFYKAFTEGGEALDAITKRARLLGGVLYSVATFDIPGLITAFKVARKSASDTTSEIAAAAAAGERLARTNQAIRREESELNVEREKSSKEVERLKKLSEDVTKSQQVRAAAAQKAYATEDGILKSQLNLQQRKIDALKLEREEGKRTDAEKAVINEAQAEYYKIEAESLGKQTELQNQLNGIRQETADKSKAAADAAKQAALEQLQLQQQIADKRVQIAQLRNQDTLALEISAIQRAADVELAQAGKNAVLRKVILLEADAKILKLRAQREAESATAVLATRKAGLEAQIALAVEGSSTQLRLQLALIRANADAEKAELERAATQTVEGRKLLQAQLLKVDADARAATEATNRAFADRQAEQQKQAAEKEAELRMKLTARIQADQDRANGIKRNKINADLAEVKRGSQEELNLRREAILIQMNEELSAEKLTKDQIREIRARAGREIADLEKGFLTERINFVFDQVQQIGGVISKLTEAGIVAQAKALDSQQKKVLDNALLSAEQRTAIEKDFQKKREALEIEAAKKRKKIATIENVIQTARAITVALVAGGPLGFVLAGVAAAMGAAQQAVIEAQQFARGGVPTDANGRPRKRPQGLVAGPGTTTSDSIPAQLSRAESVMNANTTAKYYDELSAMNVDGGGIPFPGAKPVDLSAGVQAYLANVRAEGRAAAMTSTGPVYVSAAMLGKSGLSSPGVGAIDTQLLADMIGDRVSQALAEMPAPRIVVSDYERKAKQVKVIQSMADV
ncbi:hypothetical protein A6C57_07020 [Fibrella sp. ES10-3-2-2]|nr:hypothetical protein A6C57_07020 [Fibrella sp. ES10-3-2-2]